MEIDRSRNIGITNLMKRSYATFSKGYFNFCVPFMLLGFCEDYRRVVINARYELIYEHAMVTIA